MCLFFFQKHAGFVTMDLQYDLKLDIVGFPALPFYVEDCLTILDLLCFHMNFRMTFSFSVTNVLEFY
jgi:hypothetical protein